MITQESLRPDARPDEFQSESLTQLAVYFVTTTGEDWMNRYSEAMALASVWCRSGQYELYITDPNHKIELD